MVAHTHWHRRLGIQFMASQYAFLVCIDNKCQHGQPFVCRFLFSDVSFENGKRCAARKYSRETIKITLSCMAGMRRRDKQWNSGSHRFWQQQRLHRWILLWRPILLLLFYCRLCGVAVCMCMCRSQLGVIFGTSATLHSHRASNAMHAAWKRSPAQKHPCFSFFHIFLAFQT